MGVAFAYDIDAGEIVSEAAGLMGDADLSGYVDDDDLSLLLAGWRRPGGWGNGDMSGNGYVDDDDLSLMLAHWNDGGMPPAVPLPEPATIVLLCVAAAPLLLRGKRNSSHA